MDDTMQPTAPLDDEATEEGTTEEATPAVTDDDATETSDDQTA